MTLEEWRYGVRTHGPEYTVNWALNHGLDVKYLRCLNDRSRLSAEEKFAVQAELDRRSCCDG